MGEAPSPSAPETRGMAIASGIAGTDGASASEIGANAGTPGLFPERSSRPEKPLPAAGFRALDEALSPPPLNQVRIERRVIIRISPGPAGQRARALAAAPSPGRSAPPLFREVDHGDCVPIADIAAVQAIEEDRLLLRMRDSGVMSADLGRGCNVRAFYSGFYVESSEDGNLCVARDQLHSRSGMSCQIDSLHRLVAAGN